MDAIEVLCDDHRMVEQLFRDYQAARIDTQRRGVVEIVVSRRPSSPSVLDRHPELRILEPDMQALLVNTARDQQEHWLVPIDDCFRLFAVVRREWKDLSGGSRVWLEIEQFFAELTEQR